MEILILMALMSVLGLGLVYGSWWMARRGRYGAVTPFCVLLFVASVFTACLTTLAQSFFTFVLALLWLWIRPRPSVVLAGALLAMLGPFLIWLGNALAIESWIARLRREHPIQSLAARLDYETNLKSNPQMNAPLPGKVEQQLVELETDIKHGVSERWIYLATLHDEKLTGFTRAPGFGLQRTHDALWFGPPPRPPRAPIAQPSPEYVPGVETREPADQPAVTIETNNSRVAGLHLQSLKNFLDGQSFGYVESVNYAVGFEAHHFSGSFNATRTVGDPPYRLARLELVSLLKHDRPVVYVSDNLPNMEELRDVPTRDLAAFEAKALAQLRRDENLVTEDSGNRLHMLGAIRASETCMKCHSVRRGELLGAFSYELVPAGGAARGKVEEEPAF